VVIAITRRSVAALINESFFDECLPARLFEPPRSSPPFALASPPVF